MTFKPARVSQKEQEARESDLEDDKLFDHAELKHKYIHTLRAYRSKVREERFWGFILGFFCGVVGLTLAHG